MGRHRKGLPGVRYNLNQNHHVVGYGTDSGDYLTDVLSQRAVQFIDACHRGHQPFLLEVATFAPHRPYVPAPRDAHKFRDLTAPRGPAFDRLPQNAPRWLAGRKPLAAKELAHIDRVFRNRVRDDLAVDKMIGAIEAALRRTGDAGNTDIFFSSDNGYHLGDHRLTPGKMTAFDTDIRVPLVAAGTGIARERVVTAVAENVDLAPTFETLAGLSPPARVDGRSLVPLLLGRPAREWRTAALVEHRHVNRITAGPDAENLAGVDPPSYNALRTNNYTYVEYADGSREFLRPLRRPERARQPRPAAPGGDAAHPASRPRRTPNLSRNRCLLGRRAPDAVTTMTAPSHGRCHASGAATGGHSPAYE